ncbi:photosystem reaction center subunit H [Nostoc minutum NIES-26]|uniref:Photosystem reaction center subunit H n=1 Tax=Nostoc minutum NIES-26 TaxID=1844469 RepID=A0A367RD21_9NOSO|nr:photosystem reaction center subunit H [Nostoc minutum NIES-26]
MALYRLEDFDPNYQDTFEGNDVKGLGVYTEGTNEKIGMVSDVLVDEEGHFRYLVVDLGFWIFGKKVLLPVGRSRIDYNSDRIYAVGLTREQAEDLPEFDERNTLDYDYEERVRGVYRNPSYQTSGLGTSPIIDTPAGLGTSSVVDTPTPLDATLDTSYRTTNTPIYDRDTYNYDREPSLFGLNEQNHQTLRLYEERLIANKQRIKTGEVAIGKHVETETARVAVPIERERVVIERVTPADAGKAVAPGEADFREGEVARVELHEETPDIRKEAVLREEVRVKKVVEHDTVEAQETIRREELDVNAPGLPVEER